MPNSRRQFLAAAGGMLGIGVAGQFAPALAQHEFTDAERLAATVVKPATQAAIDKALAWLAGRQNDDGSFGGSGYSRNIAVVSLAGMAFLSAGNTPGRGEYGGQINRCISYVLNAADESGFISIPATASHGPMYDHGFATLFLAEIYGMTPDSDVREKLHYDFYYIKNFSAWLDLLIVAKTIRTMLTGFGSK